MSSKKVSDLLKFLKFIINKKPIENSNPANPSKKKLMENKVKSSFIPPINTEQQYKTNHTISE
jgi:hypothetical protein